MISLIGILYDCFTIDHCTLKYFVSYEYNHFITIETTQGVRREVRFIKGWADGFGESEWPY
jgi:hypothetical protein